MFLIEWDLASLRLAYILPVPVSPPPACNRVKIKVEIIVCVDIVASRK
jgi:hypothetical protein